MLVMWGLGTFPIVTVTHLTFLQRKISGRQITSETSRAVKNAFDKATKMQLRKLQTPWVNERNPLKVNQRNEEKKWQLQIDLACLSEVFLRAKRKKTARKETFERWSQFCFPAWSKYPQVLTFVKWWKHKMVLWQLPVISKCCIAWRICQISLQIAFSMQWPWLSGEQRWCSTCACFWRAPSFA